MTLCLVLYREKGSERHPGPTRLSHWVITSGSNSNLLTCPQFTVAGDWHSRRGVVGGRVGLDRFLEKGWIREGKFWRMGRTSTAEIGRGVTGWGKHRREISLRRLGRDYWAVGCNWRGWHFSSNPMSFLPFPALGTANQQMLRKSLSGTARCQWHNDSHRLDPCHEGLVVCEFVLQSGAQGDVNEDSCPQFHVGPFVIEIIGTETGFLVLLSFLEPESWTPGLRHL